MKKHTLVLVIAMLMFALSSGCTNSQSIMEPSSSINTTRQTTTQSSTEEITTTELSSSSSLNIITTAQLIEQTTGTSALQVNPSTSNNEGNDPNVVINIGEYFVVSGKRMVDRTDPIPKEEFLKKYPITLPEGFATVDFYYEIPTEDGLRFNEVENGYIRCESEDGRSRLHVYVCKTRYVGCTFAWHLNNEPQKSYLNKTDVIISKQNNGVYRGEFEKNGYYYTFEMSNMDQEKVISALHSLVN